MDYLPSTVYAVLGGASRQAVHKSRNPVKWLAARIRRALAPKYTWYEYASPSFVLETHQRAARVIAETEKRLQAVVKPKRGPAMVNRPDLLAARFGLPYREGEDYCIVFCDIVRAFLAKITRDVAAAVKEMRWCSLQQLIDGVCPRWVNRKTGVVPAHLRKPDQGGGILPSYRTGVWRADSFVR